MYISVKNTHARTSIFISALFSKFPIQISSGWLKNFPGDDENPTASWKLANPTPSSLPPPLVHTHLVPPPVSLTSVSIVIVQTSVCMTLLLAPRTQTLLSLPSNLSQNCFRLSLPTGNALVETTWQVFLCLSPPRCRQCNSPTNPPHCVTVLN